VDGGVGSGAALIGAATEVDTGAGYVAGERSMRPGVLNTLRFRPDHLALNQLCVVLFKLPLLDTLNETFDLAPSLRWRFLRRFS